MARKYTCRCGVKFATRRHLIEHVRLLNPHWPRRSPTDEHDDSDANHPSLKKEAAMPQGRQT